MSSVVRRKKRGHQISKWREIMIAQTEQRVFQLYGAGWNNREIGRELDLDDHTVAKYIALACEDYLGDHVKVRDRHVAKLLFQIDRQIRTWTPRAQGGSYDRDVETVDPRTGDVVVTKEKVVVEPDHAAAKMLATLFASKARLLSRDTKQLIQVNVGTPMAKETGPVEAAARARQLMREAFGDHAVRSLPREQPTIDVDAVDTAAEE